jgi:hypothetical protein
MPLTSARKASCNENPRIELVVVLRPAKDNRMPRMAQSITGETPDSLAQAAATADSHSVLRSQRNAFYSPTYSAFIVKSAVTCCQI